MRVLKCFDCGKSNVQLHLVVRNSIGRMVCGCRDKAIKARVKAEVAEPSPSFQVYRLQLQMGRSGT